MSLYTPDFEQVWTAYPRGTGKLDAAYAWRTLVAKGAPEPKLRDLCLKALAWQCKLREWIEEDGKWVPRLAAYLSKRSWEDKPHRSTKPEAIPSRSPYCKSHVRGGTANSATCPSCRIEARR